MDKLLLFLICFNYFGTYLAYGIFPPYLPKVAGDQKGVDQQTIGIIMCFWYLGYAVFAIGMSHVHKLLMTRKQCIIFGLVLLAVDLLFATLCDLIDDKLIYILCYCMVRFMHGTAQAFIQVTLYSIIASCFQGEIARVVGYVEF